MAGRGRLDLGPVMATHPVFRAYRDGDEAAILRLLEGESAAACALDEWSWLFPPEEHGRQIVVGEQEGEVVAVCAGRPIRVQMHEREWAAIELHHVVPADDDDGTSVVDAFLEIFGSDDRLTLVLATHVGDALAQSGFVTSGPQRISVLVREEPAPAPLARLLYRAEPARDWEPRLDELWRRARRSYPSAVIRDADHVARRFTGHPSIRHHRFLVCPRLSSEAVALAVFTLEGDRLRWVDLVWDHDHPRALSTLAFLSGRLAGQLGAKGEELWLGGDDEAISRLKKMRFSRAELSAPPYVAARSLVPELDAEEFLRRAYLTLAGTGGPPR
jgi:hypothetical protein